MHKNWLYKIGILLFLMQGPALISHSPIALGIVCITCLAFLLSGLFLDAVSDIGFLSMFLRALAIEFLSLIVSRMLIFVVTTLPYDESVDIYVSSTIFTALTAPIAALVYNPIYRFRKRGIHYQKEVMKCHLHSLKSRLKEIASSIFRH